MFSARGGFLGVGVRLALPAEGAASSAPTKDRGVGIKSTVRMSRIGLPVAPALHARSDADVSQECIRSDFGDLDLAEIPDTKTINSREKHDLVAVGACLQDITCFF